MAYTVKNITTVIQYIYTEGKNRISLLPNTEITVGNITNDVQRLAKKGLLKIRTTIDEKKPVLTSELEIIDTEQPDSLREQTSTAVFLDENNFLAPEEEPLEDFEEVMEETTKKRKRTVKNNE
jgi:hypothetical protein